MANGRGTVIYGGKIPGPSDLRFNGRRVREAIGPNKRWAEMVLQKRMTEAWRTVFQ